jgi:hypothetical protein
MSIWKAKLQRRSKVTSTCAASAGWTAASHGVIIPRAKVQHLMLRDDADEAAAQSPVSRLAGRRG